MSARKEPLAPIGVRGQRLIDTEIFDAEYYAAESGRDFRSKRSAAVHLVQYGMKAGLSFHPLFDLGMFPVYIRDAYKIGDVESVLTYLRSPRSRQHKWSYLFDPSVLTGPSSEGSLLLSRYRAGTPRELPVPTKRLGQPLNWLDTRALMVAHARVVKQIDVEKKPLRRTTWSDLEEGAWLAGIEGIPIPSDRETPVISIVMPAWNRAPVIEEAINSVRRQTLEAWELIVVDDGSTDGTQDVVRALAEEEPRIHLVEADHQGVCAARNRGIDEARGELLAFLDTDNVWRPTFLHNMYAGLLHSGGRAAYSAARMLNEREEYTGQVITAEKLLVRNYVDLNVLVAETSLVRELGGFDPFLHRWVDYDLVLRITEKTEIEYFPFLGCDYVDDHNEDRITRRESANWEYAVLGKNLLNRFVPDAAPDRNTTPIMSIIVRITDSIDLAVRNIRESLGPDVPEQVELIVVDEVAGFRSSLRLRAALAGLSGLKYLKLPRRYTPAIAYNIAAQHAVGSALLFLRESVELRSGAIDQLIVAIADESVSGVQPLVTDTTGVVVSAGGAGHERSLATPLFRGFNLHDVERHDGRALDELVLAAFCVRTQDYRDLGGLRNIFAGDAAIVDFLRRLREASGREFARASNALAVDHSADAFSEEPALVEADAEWLTSSNKPTRALAEHYSLVGFKLDTLTAPRLPRLQPAVPTITRSTDDSGATSGLRWAIKIGADFSVGGNRWGDVPYAADLAESLTALGQEVVVDRAGAFSRPSNMLDDVVLVIRGLVRCEPQPGKVNVLWAISRPDLITRDELLGFDAIFGASRVWCDFVTTKWGIEASYLPQATNPRRFHPGHSSTGDPRYELTFVGGPRKPIGRKVVADSVRLGATVSVWGPRWEQFVPADAVVDDYISNDSLSALYRSSRIVLNDHFEDMARWGFANNRLYDAVASGARVISDHVDGIEDIFQGAVRTYTSLEELEHLLKDRNGFPDDTRMAEISRQIRDEHNFDARASTLLRAVRDCRV
ncbi:glycosyltransferase [Arthrobacter echini]|uniref:Glycosyltransferase n=1 Tax=Arthrobacter echini TaxID=1529066 RepID=A0A4V3Z5C8_9MICC|nr:glycosyltransferase [Arthrobacter echini]THJ64969.1 glycosyltransferase [Arthrobacter echini]